MCPRDWRLVPGDASRRRERTPDRTAEPLELHEYGNRSKLRTDSPGRELAPVSLDGPEFGLWRWKPVSTENTDPLLTVNVWIGNSIAATQLGGRPGVAPKQMTAAQRPKTTRADARPRF